jgi:FlaA1/EpsC-like NDP-sugar epimerase
LRGGSVPAELDGRSDDADFDGVTKLEEYLADTNPNDAADRRLSFLEITKVAGGLKLAFPRNNEAVDTNYRLEVSNDIGAIIFTISNPAEGLYASVFESCDGLDVRFNTISVLRDMSSGEVSYDKVRNLRLEDLLGRKSVTVDQSRVSRSIENGIVLVTGAGRSIRSELCQLWASFKPSKLVLLDSAEFPLFEIERSLRHQSAGLGIEPVVADVKQQEVIERVFCEKQPEHVFHTAAYKHVVPLMVAHPWRPIRTRQCFRE